MDMWYLRANGRGTGTNIKSIPKAFYKSKRNKQLSYWWWRSIQYIVILISFLLLMNNKPFGIARTIYPKEKKCQKLTIDLDNNLDNDKTISGIIWQNLKNTIHWLTHSPILNQEMLAHLKIWNQGSEQDLFACQIGLLSRPLNRSIFWKFSQDY